MVIVFFNTKNTQAQLGFCSGNSGAPIFTESFGTGTLNTSLPFGTTTYPYASGFPNDGFYTVSNGTFGNGFDWHQIQDHTPNDTNGKFLVVNAAAAAGEFYKTTITGLCETTTYEFSAWVTNLVIGGSFCSRQPGGTIPINVKFEIWDSTNTNLLASGDTGNIIETSSPFWNEYGLVFQTLVGQNAVILKMINNGQGGCGNDLAIDDIEFKSCGDLISVTDSFGNSNITLCSSETPLATIITANPDFSVFSAHFYQWQESVDGIFWTDIVGATNQSLSISINSTKYYRSKVAEVAVNLNNPQCITLSNIYQTTVNQAPPPPALQCWETATFNSATCSWDIVGTQPPTPTGLPCWQNATFNTTTCSWEVTGTQPIQPTLACWETATFNNIACRWDVTGTQPIQPPTECWETATFNTSTCSWQKTGTQPIQPNLACWETASFINATCSWEVTGTTPIQPTLACWQTASFNPAICAWEVTGTQPSQPTTPCWETAVFNTSTCSWVVSGTQPIQPTALECWETATFNTTSCSWVITGTQLGTVFSEDIVICNGETYILSPNTNLINPMYLWSTGETTETISVNTANLYTVEITTSTCVFETRQFNVTQTIYPVIENVKSEGSNIVVNILNTGDFLYSLDGTNYQPTNIFYNVRGNLYTIYVKERNCPELITLTHLHFYIPKYFTPNNDGVNDTFNLSGIELFNESQVSIFNRYGKLLKFSKNSPFSWDGTFNNAILPTDDYWYVIVIDGQKYSGHFTLKR